MESNYVSLCVTRMTPDGNYLATTPTGKEVMILRNDISIRGPGKFPENFVNQTLKAVPLEVQQDGYDLYSPWIYENDLLDEMAGNLANGNRNVYDAELAYIGYADGYLLFKINQGILGCVTANRFSMSGLCDFNLVHLERGMKLPLTVLSIDKATGRIPCSTLATFGSFEENVAALGLEPGAEVTGLVTDYLPANPNQLVVMLGPNISVLIDARDELRIGMNVKVIVEKVDMARRKVHAVPKQPLEAEPAAPWKLDPFVSSPPAYVDNEEFFQKNRVRKKAVIDISTIPPIPAKSSPPPDVPTQLSEDAHVEKTTDETKAEPSLAAAAQNSPIPAQNSTLTASTPFVTLPDDTITLSKPGMCRSFCALQMALQEQRITKDEVQVAEVVAALRYASTSQIADFITLTKPNSKRLVEKLPGMLNTLCDMNVLSGLSVKTPCDGHLLIYYGGTNHHKLIQDKVKYEVVPYTGMDAAVTIKPRLAATSLFLALCRKNEIVFYETNTVLKAKGHDHSSMHFPYTIHLAGSNAITHIDAVRSGSEEAVLKELKWLARHYPGHSLALVCETTRDLHYLASEIRAMRLPLPVHLTTDKALETYQDQGMQVTIEANKNPVSRAVQALLASLC